MTLPGMPIHAGDPGVFICGPADIAPWESQEPRARVDVASPARVRAWTGAGWIVANLCRRCNARTEKYCDSHEVLWVWK